MNISYTTLFRISMFSLGIGATAGLNHTAGTESTVLIIGGICVLLMAERFNQWQNGDIRPSTEKIKSILLQYQSLIAKIKRTRRG